MKNKTNGTHNGKHKQSKCLTLMLVPDSSAKVRSIRISYWTLSILAIPLVSIMIIVGLFQTRVFALESLLDFSASQLSATVDEKDRLRETLLDNEVSAEPYERHNEQAVPEEEAYTGGITEEQLEYVLARLSVIDGMKDGIIGVFNDIAAMEAVPFLFDESTLSGSVVRAQGGQYTGGPENVIAELDSILAGSLDSMSALTGLAEGLEEYFGARPSGWPVTEGQVTSEFGYRPNPFTGRGLEMHDGIDIGVPVGTEVFATAPGVVEFAGWHTMGFGYLVVIVHDFGYSTFYAHNSEVLVTLGQEVERGQVIALSGNTGRSTAPHVHYEVRHNGVPINPRQFLG